MAYKQDEYQRVNYLWDDAKTDQLDSMERLRYRTNILGGGLQDAFLR